MLCGNSEEGMRTHIIVKKEPIVNISREVVWVRARQRPPLKRPSRSRPERASAAAREHVPLGAIARRRPRALAVVELGEPAAIREREFAGAAQAPNLPAGQIDGLDEEIGADAAGGDRVRGGDEKREAEGLEHGGKW